MDSEKMAESAGRSFARLSRFLDQLARGHLASGPVTLQQCHVILSLRVSAMSMGELAAEAGLHQSTMTRIVEKLEKAGYVRRKRVEDNQRSVVVELTAKGVKLAVYLKEENRKLVGGMLELIPLKDRKKVVESLELLTGLFSPSNPEYVRLLEDCCSELSCNCGGKK